MSERTRMSSRLGAYTAGIVLTVNFIVFWSIPIFVQGVTWKFLGLKYILLPLYRLIDENTSLRKFAAAHIYSKEEYVDYFSTSVLLLINSIFSIGTVFYWQLRYGALPWWLIIAYYLSWVGAGGRIMGAAYALAHKEGHNYALYQKWIRESFGNFFENWLGVFFGNVPFNFTTSHVFIHHRLDGGIGDTFYEWDLDRTNPLDFMLYVNRIFFHMIGYSSLNFFDANGLNSKGARLRNGVKSYIFTGFTILVMTRSVSFLFWIYLQPLFCMAYFLALLNIGFHGFIEFDQDGKSSPYVNATTIIDGDDDYFGEDDHMAHHYHTNVFYRDLPSHQLSKSEEFAKCRASVFRNISIVELSIFIILGLWDKLADHYVDYSKKMTKAEVMEMLKIRAQRTEMSYEVYEEYMKNPTSEARKALFQQKSRLTPREIRCRTQPNEETSTLLPQLSASSSRRSG